MADSYQPGLNKPRKLTGILKWYDGMHQYHESRALDTAINIAIAGLLMVITFTIAAQFIITRPSITYNDTGNCTASVQINYTHARNRMLRNVKSALENSCNEYNDVNIGTNVLIDNTSSKMNIFYICDRKMHFVNAKVIKTGNNRGRCSESYNNSTKTKERKFPVVVKDTYTNTSHTFYTLRDSCAIHSAMERLKCDW